MKNLLLFAMLFCMAGTTIAQCPDPEAPIDDVKVIYSNAWLVPGGMHLIICRGFSLHNDVVFQFNQNFNIGSNGTLWINFGDGQTEQIAGGAAVTHVYPLNSSNITYNVSVVLKEPGFPDSHSNVHGLVIKASSSVNSAGYIPPDETWRISNNTTYNPPVEGAFPPGSIFNSNALGGAQAYIKYAPAHNGKLLKPLIFVDGVDFNTKTYTYNGDIIRHGSTGWDVLVMGNDASEPNELDVDSLGVPVPSEFSYYPTAFNILMSEPNNYDIIFLDFAEGADWIEKNGLELIELIKRVNARKEIYAVNGETVCDNAIVGASMGGQVAKWALSMMEEQGIPHQTHTYVSFDSPHQGAYIPLSLQAFSLLSNRAHIETEPWEDLNTPAARQMLIRHIGGPGVQLDYSEDHSCNSPDYFQISENINIEYPLTAEIRSNYADQITTLGYPQTTRNVAISCGSRTGATQGIPGGGVMFEAGLDVGINPIAGLCTLPGNEQLGYAFYAQLRTAYGGPPGNREVFHLSVCQPITYHFGGPSIFAGFMPKDLISFQQNEIPCLYSYLSAKTTIGNFPNFENASGCSRTDMIGLKKLMADKEVDVMSASDRFTFMPTISTLDIQWPMDDEHLTMGFNELAIVSNGLTPFDAVYAPEANLRHVELTAGMVSWLIGQLELGLNVSPTLHLTSGQSFNYGHRKNRVPDVTINNGARLAVNITGTINYMTSLDPLADHQHFDVYTGGGCDQGKVVTIKSGGILQIGDPGSAKTGLFHALAQAVVHVENGGILRISNASGLKIYKGATLILDPGAIVQLDAEGAHIRIEGDLVVNGDIDFRGLGYFDFAQGNKLVYGPGVQNFRLTGAGKGKRCVRLSSSLFITPGHGIYWKEGMVSAIGQLLINTGGECSMENMDVVGLDELDIIIAQSANMLSFLNTDFNHARVTVLSNNSGQHYFRDCHFENMENGIIADGGNGSFVLSECVFDQYKLEAVKISNRPTFESNYSTWDGQVGVTGLDLLSVGKATLKGCSMSGHDENCGAPFDPEICYYGRAITSDGVSYLVLNDCALSQNEIGICADGIYEGPSNVFLLNGTSISNSMAGVYMLGNATKGLVLMDCAMLIDNEFGIFGKDVVLMIDAINAQQHPLDGAAPNAFIRNGSHANTGKYFDICYFQKSPVQPIPMRRNWWAVENWDWRQLNPEAFMSIRRQNCTIPVTVDTKPELTAPPSPCSPEEFIGLATGKGEESACDVQLSPMDPPTDLSLAWHTAYQQLRLGDFDEAEIAFQPVADMWSTDLSSFSNNCQLYIQVAKAIVDGGAQRPSMEHSSSNDQSNAYAAPNPTTGIFSITTPEKQCTVRVLNAQGSLCYEAISMGGAAHIDASIWPVGIYMVGIQGTDYAQQIKLIVQR